MFLSGSVTIISDFWQPFCVGIIMAASRQGRGKRLLLVENDGCSTQPGRCAMKLFARQTELRSATLARAIAIFFARAKTQKISEYRDTAPLTEMLLRLSSTGRGTGQIGETG